MEFAQFERLVDDTEEFLNDHPDTPSAKHRMTILMAIMRREVIKQAPDPKSPDRRELKAKLFALMDGYL